MLSRHRFCCYMCLPNALLLRGCGLHILPTLVFITLACIDYFNRVTPLEVDTSVDFEPTHIFFLCFFYSFIYFMFFFIYFIFYVFIFIFLYVFLTFVTMQI